MNVLAATAPPPADASAWDALWRLAYAITGDRATASAVVAEALERLPTGVTPARRYREVAALARARTRPARTSPAVGRQAPHDRLWEALRPLPRRQRAQIVQRLAR